MPEANGKRSFGARAIFMVAGMLITGTANTLLNKNQDLQCVENCNDPNPKEHVEYNQPVWQTLNMFIGEAMCLLVYLLITRIGPGLSTAATESSPEQDEEKQRLISDPADAEDKVVADFVEIEDDVRQLTGWANFLLWLPAIFDIIGTTLMNVGLMHVAASIYQMLRGAVVIFTGLLSLIFLKAKIPLYRCYALFIIVFGVSIVGMSPVLFGAKDASAKGNALLGVLLVLGAQIFTAIQFVAEEKILMRYTIQPIKMVGLEGLFGLLTVVAGMGVMHFAYGQGTEGIFDVVYGFNLFVDYPRVWGSGLAAAFSIGAFNWFGLNITKYVSATSRSTIDTCRTLFVWLFSLALGWEIFLAVQLAGFALLIYGTFVFNNVIAPCPGSLLKKKTTTTTTSSSS